jgi:hypothetical protein
VQNFLYIASYFPFNLRQVTVFNLFNQVKKKYECGISVMLEDFWPPQKKFNTVWFTTLT